MGTMQGNHELTTKGHESKCHRGSRGGGQTFATLARCASRGEDSQTPSPLPYGTPVEDAALLGRRFRAERRGGQAFAVIQITSFGIARPRVPHFDRYRDLGG